MICVLPQLFSTEIPHGLQALESSQDYIPVLHLSSMTMQSQKAAAMTRHRPPIWVSSQATRRWGVKGKLFTSLIIGHWKSRESRLHQI